MTDGPWTSSVSARFDGSAGTVREVRRFVSDAVGATPPAVADLAVLLASELATNAVIHAPGAYVVTVRCGADGDRVRVEVADRSPASARRCRYSSTSATGRGLGMVEDAASAWGIEPRPGAIGKAVWFELVVPTEADGDDRRASSRVLAVDDDVEVDLDALLDELGGWDDGDLEPQARRRAS